MVQSLFLYGLFGLVLTCVIFIWYRSKTLDVFNRYAVENRERMRARRNMRTWGWTTESWVVVALLVFFCVDVPLFFAAYTSTNSTGITRAVLEFIVGTWPNQVYDVPADKFRTDIWLPVGVGFRTFMTFGLPTTFAVIFTLLLARVRKLERGLKMTLLQFIGDRDEHLKTEVYAEFRQVLEQANIPGADRLCEELVEDAFQRASREWDKTISNRYRSALEGMVFPE